MKEKFIGYKVQVWGYPLSNMVLRPETAEQRFTENDPHGRTAHAIKSVAGHDFHNKYVKSVCVFNQDGDVLLWLNKNRQQECVARESA